MVTVETLLLVGLGFLIAGLLVLLMAPLYWGRAVRITTARIRAALPVDENEVEAEYSRLRAQHALSIHDLKSELDRLQLISAQSRIDINRRDAQISELKQGIEELQTALEVNENARRVLEQTITDRVPDVERHLREAQRSLEQRDREVSRLRVESAKAYRALQEAIDIGDQQRAEIGQLNERLETRTPRSASEARAAASDGELALRGELERLRARSRAQGLTISDLVQRLQRHGEAVALPEASGIADGPQQLPPPIPTGTSLGDPLSGLFNSADMSPADATRLSALEETIADRDAEIRVLKETLASLEKTDDGRTPRLRGSAASAIQDAKVKELETRLQSERARARALQAELVAANDKLARQAAHFMDELRRLGGRRSTTSGRGADGSGRGASHDSRRPSLRERIVEEVSKPTEPVEDAAASAGTMGAADGDSQRRPRLVARPPQPANDATGAPPGQNESQARPNLVARISNMDEPE